VHIARRTAIILGLWTVPGVLAGVETFCYQIMEGGHPALWRVMLQQCCGWWAWAAFTPVVFAKTKRFPLRLPVSGRTVTVHVIASLVATLVYGTVYTLVNVLLATTPPRTALSQLLFRNLIGWLPITVLIYVGLVSAGHWMELATREREREQRTLALEAQLAGAQLQALRMQLHPHFLFNTLNTIAALVREQDVTASVRLISQLGDVLRQVLRSAEQQEVTLAEELAFTGRYLEIEQVRFADRLRVRWAADDDVRGVLVPYLILQPLVENALRHGIARREEAGLVEIGARRRGDRLVLWVRDDGPGLMGPKVSTESSERIGTANVRARLAALYHEDGTLALDPVPLDDGGGMRATISLPFRHAPAERPALETTPADV
jgi:two-component system LytT family sensor kinase